MQGLGFLGGPYGNALGINSTGQVVGVSTARAAGSARSHFHDVQCSTARIKGTRGTRYFAPDALSQPVASTP